MNTCVNGGRCKASPDFKSYTCECPDRFEGLNCERQEDPCKYERCMNGGVCIATREQSYTCSCPHGFHGLLCEKSKLNSIGKGPLILLCQIISVECPSNFEFYGNFSIVVYNLDWFWFVIDLV